MLAHMLRWAFFSVLMAMTPLIAATLRLNSIPDPPDWGTAVGQGQLLLVTTTLCGAALGEIIGSGQRHATLKTATAGTTLLVVVLATMYFGELAIAAARHNALDAHIVKRLSLLIFSCGLASAGGCMLLSKEKND